MAFIETFNRTTEKDLENLIAITISKLNDDNSQQRSKTSIPSESKRGIDILFDNTNLPDIMTFNKYYQKLYSFEFKFITNDWQYNYTVNTLESSLYKYISDNIAQVREVEYIYIYEEAKSITVYSIINKLDRKVRHKIYDYQKKIMSNLPEFIFDFYVVARQDQTINNIAPSDFKIIYKRKK